MINSINFGIELYIIFITLLIFIIFIFLDLMKNFKFIYY